MTSSAGKQICTHILFLIHWYMTLSKVLNLRLSVSLINETNNFTSKLTMHELTETE